MASLQRNPLAGLSQKKENEKGILLYITENSATYFPTQLHTT